MSTLSINYRPAPVIAAAAALAAIAAGSLAMSLGHDSDQPAAPGQQSQTSVRQDTPNTHHFSPTTSGGRVMVGP